MLRFPVLTRIILGMLTGLAFGVAISEATYYFLRDGEARPPRVIEIHIPPGTAQNVLRGQPEPSLPDSMRFVVGDTLVVNNLDSVTHQLGPLFIPPNSTASLKLDSVQNYAASCTFQPGRYFGLEVQPPLTIQTRLIGILQAGIPMGLLFVLYGVFAIPMRKAVTA
ncbi:MAG: hypothetical protein V1755_15775 [Chloroflexota bacterium]